VLFDVDGVLVDSHRAYRHVWDRWALLHGLDVDVVWAATHARRPAETVAEVAPELEAEAEYLRLKSFVRQLGDVFPVFPDAAPLLATLTPGSWGIVTSGEASTVRARLRAGGLPVPELLVDGHAVRRGKPDPEGYLSAAADAGVPPHRCLVVEDAPAGVQAARRAGMSVVAVTTSHAPEQLAEADVVVPGLSDVEPHLRAWRERGG
jgi:sugar-phosphatase